MAKWQPHYSADRSAAAWFAYRNQASIVEPQSMIKPDSGRGVILPSMMESNNCHHPSPGHPIQNEVAIWTFRLPVLISMLVLVLFLVFINQKSQYHLTVKLFSNRYMYLYFVSYNSKKWLLSSNWNDWESGSPSFGWYNTIIPLIIPIRTEDKIR